MPVVARGAATESQAADFVRSALPNSGTWTPTLVNPAKQSSTPAVLLFWGHLLLHVCSLGLSGFNGFGIGLLQKGDSACATTDMSCFTTAPNGGLMAIAIAGSSCQVIGVVLILVFSAFIYANDLKKYIWATSLMFFFLNFSMAASFLVWAMASYRYHSLAFWLATPGVIIQLFSLMMVFSTSAALGSKNIVRTFVMTAAVSMDLIVALLYQVGTWNRFGAFHIEPTQKSIMWYEHRIRTIPTPVSCHVHRKHFYLRLHCCCCVIFLQGCVWHSVCRPSRSSTRPHVYWFQAESEDDLKIPLLPFRNPPPVWHLCHLRIHSLWSGGRYL